MNNLSFSSLYRALACGWEFRDDAEHAPPRDGGDGHLGSAVHEAYLCPGSASTVEEIAAKYSVSAAEVMSYGPPIEEALLRLPNVGLETAYAFDPKTELARALGHHIERRYEEAGALSHEIPGTTDIEYEADGTLVVADLKTGYADHVEPVAGNSQLLMGMLCSASVRRWSGPMRLELWFARPGRLWIESADVTVIELWDFAARLKDRLRLLPVLAPQPGDHCRYCSSLGCCPASKETMGGIVEAGKYGWSTNIVNTEHAAWLAERLPMARKMIDAMKEALESYSDSIGGIPLSDGKVWRRIVSSYSTLNTTAVKERLADEIDRYMTTAQRVQYRAVKK